MPLFIGPFFFLSAQTYPPTLYLSWYYCVVAFPSVLGALMLKKPGTGEMPTNLRWQPRTSEWGTESKSRRTLEQEAPPPHLVFRLPLKTLGFPIYGNTEIMCFVFCSFVFYQKVGVKLIESNIWLKQEAKNVSKCLVQLWNHNNNKYNEIRMEKMIPTR